MILAEALLLVALDDGKGNDTTSWGADPALAGALLIDLVADGHLREADGRLEPAASAPRHPTLRAAHEIVAADDKRRKPKAWVDRLPGKLKPLRERIAEPLVDAGVLSEERRKRLGLFETVRFPTADPEPERELRDGLRAVLVDGAEPTPWQARLIALLEPLDLVDDLVAKDERKAAKARAKQVAERGAETEAVKSAIDGLQAAVLVAATTAATSTAVTSGN